MFWEKHPNLRPKCGKCQGRHFTKFFKQEDPRHQTIYSEEEESLVVDSMGLFNQFMLP